MKKVEIKYNPYVLETVIKVDGMDPKPNSSLNAGKKRLQEWVDKLPELLYEEYRDGNLEVEYIGTESDFEELRQAFDSCKDVAATFQFHKTADIVDVEQKIDELFEEIKNGPIAELKDERIILAFEKAKDSKFEINVVATMSSGKSTLINALLGKQLMPAKNEATTATIVKIIDTEQENFSAIAFNNIGQIVKKLDNVTLEDMQELNANTDVSTIVIKGKIPFIASTGMKLVLVDTPGPNNSRDKRHEEMTYKMIADSEKSLVLYVMNGEQLGINDEKIFLDYVCQSMKDGGKKARERFIFAINRMDVYNPDPDSDYDGPDCITKALDNVKLGLEERGIDNPNIFPVCSLPALQKRADIKQHASALIDFVAMCGDNETMHFENYYEYNNLPLAARNRIENLKTQSTDANDAVEIHTGIVSIEQAISLYINKYARTTKVKDLIQSFNEKLDELAAYAHLEAAIREDENAKAEIDQQIQIIKEAIESAKNAQIRSKNIDSIDLVTSVNKSLEEYFSTINTQISKMISGETKVEKTKALNQCKEIEKQCKAIAIQITVQIEKIIQDAYKTSINKVVEEYKKYLADLNLNVNSSALAFSPIPLISASLADLSAIVKDNTLIVDESYEADEEYKVKIEGTKGRNAVGGAIGGAIGGAATGAAIGSFIPGVGTFIGGIAGALIGAAGGATGGAISGKPEHYETRIRKKLIKKEGQYIDMRTVSQEYTQEFQESVINVKDQTTDFVAKETARLKDHLKEELKKIDDVLKNKLDSLSKVEADSKIKAEELAQKQANLKWLEDIQDRVTNIINF